MAQNYRANLIRRALCARIACFFVTFCVVTAAFANSRVNVFQATVPAPDRSEAGQTGAFQAALRVVLIKATGRRAAAEDAVFAPLVGSARRYVQQYRSTPDNQLWVAFDGAAIERWLTQNGQPLWGPDRPSTFVWLTVQAATQPAAPLTADDTSELKTAIDAAAADRGIPLVWPTADGAAGGATGATGNVADIGHRLGAEGVLIGRATANAATAAVHWTFTFQDHSTELSGPVEGVNHAADLYAGLYAASGSLAPIDIEVDGLADVGDYAAVEGYLESLSFVTHVAVESLGGDTVRFRLTARGGLDPLQHAIALNGRLQALSAGQNGIARFQLRR